MWYEVRVTIVLYIGYNVAVWRELLIWLHYNYSVDDFWFSRNFLLLKATCASWIIKNALHYMPYIGVYSNVSSVMGRVSVRMILLDFPTKMLFCHLSIYSFLKYSNSISLYQELKFVVHRTNTSMSARKWWNGMRRWIWCVSHKHQLLTPTITCHATNYQSSGCTIGLSNPLSTFYFPKGWWVMTW